MMQNLSTVRSPLSSIYLAFLTNYQSTSMSYQQDFTPEFMIATGPSATVPNERPQLQSAKRLAIISDAPTQIDCSERRPLVGPNGNLLFGLLRNAGITRSECYVANLSQTMPPGELNWEWPGIHAGIEILREELKDIQPHLIILLGNMPLKAFDPTQERKITDWRGSLLMCHNSDSPFYGFKCLPVIHPSAVFFNWEYYYLCKLDLRRAVFESETPKLDVPQPNIEILKDPDVAIMRLEQITGIDHLVSMDIEGTVLTVSCISFAVGPQDVFVVPLELYTLEQRARVFVAISKFCVSSTPKTLQNSLYDNFVLSWAYRIPIMNVVHDTMLSGWEIYPELPKSLACQTSIWTKQPFYKFERKSDLVETFYNYCGKDSAVTYEINVAHRKRLDTQQKAHDHYRFNMSLLRPTLYMELRGIKFDRAAADVLLAQYRTELSTCLNVFNTTLEQLLPGIAAPVKKLTKKQVELNAVMGDLAPRHLVNLSSPKQVADLLYVRLGIPKRFKKAQGKITDDVTTGVDALLDLLTAVDGPQKQILELILEYRRVEKFCQTLSKKVDNDFRMRAGYNVVGTETGRFTCYTSPTGNGDNLQTITKKLRVLFCADPGMHLFQCDLSGADGWTVAAHCARLGDCTMLDDYYAGIKPAKIIALMYKHGVSINNMDRETLRLASKEINEEGADGWLYFASKRVQHGTNYMLGKNTMAVQIMKDSYKLKGKPIYLTPVDCVRLQTLYLTRYPGVRRWQQWNQDQIKQSSTLGCASGHVRKFFGRRDSNETYRAACAHEPQANTTYATNCATLKLWRDPCNRQPNNTLIIEPLHQVHDALIGQFPKDQTFECIARIRSYFDNPLIIAGHQITIPFEGAYGPSWGQLGADYGGGSI